MYWIYDIHSVVFFLLCNLFFVTIALFIRNFIQSKIVSKLEITEKHNDLLNYFVIALGAFYSITLGLIAVDTWEFYKDSKQLTSREASCISALYEDVKYYPKTISVELQKELKHYTEYIINNEWKIQQNGVIPKGKNLPLQNFHKLLYTFNPNEVKYQLIHSETISKYNDLVDIRLNRLNNIQEGLPTELWLVIFTEAFLLMFLFSFFVDRNKRFHKLLIVSLGIIVGTTIFLVAIMNYPYRGEFSVSSEPFKVLSNDLLKSD